MTKKKLSPVVASHKMWASQEFRTLDLLDKRLKKRAIRIAGDFAADPQASIPEASGGNWDRIKSTYRFFDNEAVSAEALVAAHRDATIDRMRREPLVIAIQDTSF